MESENANTLAAKLKSAFTSSAELSLIPRGRLLKRDAQAHSAAEAGYFEQSGGILMSLIFVGILFVLLLLLYKLFKNCNWRLRR